MNIEKTQVDNLNAIISINIGKDDYEKKFKSELSKYAAKAQIKGFRKGKTPHSVIKKMYGRSVLAEVVNDTLQHALSDYLQKEDLPILGQPIPADDQDGNLSFDVNNLEDYEFKYEIGLSPEIDIQGVSKSDKYDIDSIDFTDEIINEELENARKRLGTQEKVEGKIEENDIIKVQAEELDGKKVKENGWANEFSLHTTSLTDDYKKKVLKLKTGDSFEFDVYKLEKEKTEEYVKKYLLDVKEPEEGEEAPEIGNMFKGEITEISRLKLAELDQEFYDKYYGEGEVKTEEEAKEKIKEQLKSHFDNQALQLMYRNIMDKLVADTKVDLPESFLKKWLKITNEKLSDSEIDAEFTGFLDNMRWTLIKSKLAKQFEIEVTREDIQEAMAMKIRSYMGNYGQQLDDSFMNDIMSKMMSNQEEVNKTYEELQAGKVFNKIGEQVKKNEVSISLDDFNNKVKALNEKQRG